MPEYQVYLYDEQKQLLLKYVRKKRSGKIRNIFISAVIFIYEFLLLNGNVAMKNSFEIKSAVVYHSVIIVMSGFAFVVALKDGFGKNFGFMCDKKCIESDRYTITRGKFFSRDKNPHNKPPYYVSDALYNKYVCLRFADWRYATEDTDFIYIKLENGRNYAIVDK